MLCLHYRRVINNYELNPGMIDIKIQVPIHGRLWSTFQFKKI